MLSLEDLRAFERQLAARLRGAEESGAELLPQALQDCLERIDADGLRVSQMLIARLRFERLMQGSATARRWFAEDAAGFAVAFRRYAERVPCPSIHPWDEARAFAAFAAES